MRVIIWKRNKGRKPEIWADNLTLSAAKKKLSDLYLQSIEFFIDELNEDDGISADKKQLKVCNNQYWIEKDTRL